MSDRGQFESIRYVELCPREQIHNCVTDLIQKQSRWRVGTSCDLQYAGQYGVPGDKQRNREQWKPVWPGTTARGRNRIILAKRRH